MVWDWTITMTKREPNPDDAPYRPVPPGGKPWPGYPKPKPAGPAPKLKLAKKVSPRNKKTNDPNVYG